MNEKHEIQAVINNLLRQFNGMRPSCTTYNKLTQCIDSNIAELERLKSIAGEMVDLIMSEQNVLRCLDCEVCRHDLDELCSYFNRPFAIEKHSRHIRGHCPFWQSSNNYKNAGRCSQFL